MKMVLCDTDVLIELYKGNEKVLEVLESIGDDSICISDVTAGELLFGARNKRELNILRTDIGKTQRLPISTSISTLAIELILQYTLSQRLSLPDALIAATSVVHKLPLYTLNQKDFRFLEVKLYE